MHCQKSFSQGMSIFSEESSKFNTHPSHAPDTNTLASLNPRTATHHLQPASHSTCVPEHLADLYALMNEPCDLDRLVFSSQKDTSSLLAELMELEILGLIEQVGGRYGRL